MNKFDIQCIAHITTEMIDKKVAGGIAIDYWRHLNQCIKLNVCYNFLMFPFEPNVIYRLNHKVKTFLLVLPW